MKNKVKYFAQWKINVFLGNKLNQADMGKTSLCLPSEVKNILTFITSVTFFKLIY